MSDSNVTKLGVHHKQRTPLDVLRDCMEDFPDMSDVYVIMYDKEGNLLHRSTNMVNRDALWMLSKEMKEILEAS